jgi:hypothetical protein
MSILQHEDIAFFERNWPKFDIAASALDADAYAEKHAAGLPATVKLAVARLALRYMVEEDTGERECLRVGIDSLILMWR